MTKVAPGGKRELLARGMYRLGLVSLLRRLPKRDSVLIINHHRIGSEDGPGGAGYSATAEELDDQVSWLKRNLPVVGLDEAIDSLIGTRKSRGCRVLITFDDGYQDNYAAAFPILRSHGVPGVFFLVTSFVSGGHAPWWDQIAHLLRTAARRSFTLRYPATQEVDLDRDGGPASLRRVLDLYKRPDNADGGRFLNELAEACRGERHPASERLFLNWAEASEMLRGGMFIGSHTHTHPVLSQLSANEQRRELELSRRLLQEALGIACDTLAYPVGRRDSYTAETEALAAAAGYRAAFSFHGGVNAAPVRPYDIFRVGGGGQSRERFRVQAAVCASTGRYWP